MKFLVEHDQNSKYVGVLVRLSSYNKNTTDCTAYTTTFISHISEGWKVPDQSNSRFSVS